METASPEHFTHALNLIELFVFQVQAVPASGSIGGAGTEPDPANLCFIVSPVFVSMN